MIEYAFRGGFGYITHPDDDGKLDTEPYGLGRIRAVDPSPDEVAQLQEYADWAEIDLVQREVGEYEAARELPLVGQELKIVPGIDDGYVPYTEYQSTTDPDEATIITSRMAVPKGSSPAFTPHRIVLDLDMPAKLIPSSTPGHFHLYIDHVLPWHSYVRLLDALAEAGVIEDGYRGASVARGFTAARLPWVRKGQAPALDPEPGPPCELRPSRMDWIGPCARVAEHDGAHRTAEGLFWGMDGDAA